MLCCVWSAFHWLITRGSYKYESGTYPLVLTVSDLVDMFVWVRAQALVTHLLQLTLMCILYTEWNRKLPHGIVLRLFFLGCTAANVIKYETMSKALLTPSLVSLNGIASESNDNSLSKIVDYYGSARTPIVMVVVQGIVAFLMVLGIFPAIRKHIEPSDYQEKHEVGVIWTRADRSG